MAPSQVIKLKPTYYYYLHSLILSIEYWLLQAKYISVLSHNPIYHWWFRWIQKKGFQIISRKTGLKTAKMKTLDHHLAHAYSAIFASPLANLRKKVLIFTCDGSGDGLSATISSYQNGRIHQLHQTPAINSLGNFYAFITGFLGMKPLEHEYKVMGLAPYSCLLYTSPSPRD